ncbi:MAG: ketose-bisphosphate aldolase [Desulfobulbaceae bacterium]|nr:MAG: ketose-bisphosphate aldolase [Desulfobulbaceae bacterium]
MPIVNATEMLLKATAENYAVGAFNVTNFIQMKAVVETAVEKKSPVIIQTSVTPSKFRGPTIFAAVFRAMANNAPVPICLHIDHCNEVDYCKRCADAGYTNVMIDASYHDFEENIRQTREVADYCHTMNISVEGELGTVSGVEYQVVVAADEAQLCDPDLAVEFVDKTGIDLLAPAIGTAHGVYKTKNPVLDFERLATIAEKINGSGPKTPLVIHGGTGLTDETVKKLVSLGGSKFNVSTELKHRLLDTTHDYLVANRDQYDPGKVDKVVLEAISGVIGKWMDLLGSSGRA